MTADQLRKSILQQAIQGKLVPQDPNDEPASVLLERIREEKARLVEEKKIKKEKNPSVIFRGEDNSYYEKFTLSGEVKCIDEEIPFEIPNGWEWARIKNVSQSYIGLTYKPQDINEKGIIVLRSSNIKDGKVVLQDIVRVTKDISDKLLVKENDIIICARNGSQKLVGKSALIGKLIEPITFGAFMAICKTSLYKYAYLFLQSDYFFSQLKKVSGTTTINQLTQDNLNSFLLPIPPFAEQQRIVEKIEELIPHIEHYSKAQAELDTINKNIKEQLKKSILQYAIEGKLVPQYEAEGTAEELLLQIQAEKQKLYEEGKLKKKDLEHSTIFKDEDNKYYEKIGKECIDITNDIFLDLPISWRWCRLKDIVSIFTGATFKKEEVGVENIDIRILRGGNIQPFKLTNRVDDIFLPKDKVKESILLKKNDIVTPAVTSLENIGKMARVEFDLESTTVGGFVFILRQFYCNDILSKYLLALLSSPVLIDYIKSITNKSGQAFYNISKNRLEMTLLPLPPLAEQQRIVESIDAIFRCIEN